MLLSHQRISTGARYVTLDNKIKYLSLAVFVLGNPTNKTVTVSSLNNPQNRGNEFL
jgi:hypothetical protein